MTWKGDQNRTDFFTTEPTLTISMSGSQKVRHLGRWQQWIHRIGTWLQDFAYRHSPETEEWWDNSEAQSTYTSMTFRPRP